MTYLARNLALPVGRLSPECVPRTIGFEALDRRELSRLGRVVITRSNICSNVSLLSMNRTRSLVDSRRSDVFELRVLAAGDTRVRSYLESEELAVILSTTLSLSP